MDLASTIQCEVSRKKTDNERFNQTKISVKNSKRYVFKDSVNYNLL